jgi:anti-sigma factor RsiW
MVRQSTMLSAAMALTLLVSFPQRAIAEDQEDPDERPPTTGVPFLVTGGILTGTGALTFAAAPFYCAVVQTASALEFQSAAQSSSAETLCWGLFIAAGLTQLAIGIPMIAVGSAQRHRYIEWRKDHPIIERVSIIPVNGGAGLAWHAEF